MFKLVGKEIYAILGAQTILFWTYVESLLSALEDCFVLINGADPDEMQHNMRHFIWLYTVGQSTWLWNSRQLYVKMPDFMLS